MSVREEEKGRLWQEIRDKGEVEMKPLHSPMLSQGREGPECALELCSFSFRLSQSWGAAPGIPLSCLQKEYEDSPSLKASN